MFAGVYPYILEFKIIAVRLTDTSVTIIGCAKCLVDKNSMRKHVDCDVVSLDGLVGFTD